ncbi:MAG: hypothetical protein NTY04_01645 [Candidatus Staskawiczbacteria bacterium]|nr:hypothetical protein [Candidatus Staskawiczbacteria bacterium]
MTTKLFEVIGTFMCRKCKTFWDGSKAQEGLIGATPILVCGDPDCDCKDVAKISDTPLHQLLAEGRGLPTG